MNCSGKYSKLKSALMNSSMLASRLNHYSTQVSESFDFLWPLKFHHSVCTNFETKYNTYSFHIEIPESEAHLLLDDNLWPEAVLYIYL